MPRRAGNRSDANQQALIAKPLASRATTDVPKPVPIPQLRADADACSNRLASAVAEVHRLIEGGRVVIVKIAGHFNAGIDTAEQLDAALGGLRDECLHHIGKNKAGADSVIWSAAVYCRFRFGVRRGTILHGRAPLSACPGGAFENSPAIYRWVRGNAETLVP